MIKVRAMVPADANAVAALADEFADYLRGLGDEGDHNLTAEAIRRDGFGPNAAFAGLVAAPAGVPVPANALQGGGGRWGVQLNAPTGLAGYLLYHLGYDADRAERNLHVIDLYVSHAARRQGAGRALMAEAARLCRALGGTHLFWAVYVPNRLAADFYTALGAQYVQDLDYMAIEAEGLTPTPEK